MRNFFLLVLATLLVVSCEDQVSEEVDLYAGIPQSSAFIF
jgi:hypothetical protein